MRIYKEQGFGYTDFILKLVAMFSMLADHVGYMYNWSWVRGTVGRIAFPLYAYMVVEAYCHLRERPKTLYRYFIMLGGLGILSEWQYAHFFFKSWNQISHLFICICTVWCVDKWIHSQKQVNSIVDKVIKYFGVVFIISLSAYFQETFNIGYKAFGLFLIFSFVLYKNYAEPEFRKKCLWLCVIMVVSVLVCENFKNSRLIFYDFSAYLRTLPDFIGCLFCIPLLVFYNGQHMKRNVVFKWFYRLFYPVHLFVLYLIWG